MKQSNGSILIVEDDADTREVYERALVRAGHHVVLASNGWEALLALDRHEVDLVVLDLMMPGMDGPTFLDILRNDRRRSHLPVLALTALSEGKLFDRTRRLGVAAMLPKAHITIQEMLWNVEQCLLEGRHLHPPTGFDIDGTAAGPN